MSKFKAGDLAMVIKANHEENLGKVVTLLQSTSEEIIDCGRGEKTSDPNRLLCWVIQHEGLVASTTFGFKRLVNVGARPESWLMPLNGDFQPEQQKAKEVEA
ncbi:hypothetical protein DZ952_012075 [Pseudomonas aeruginosa]|uniref:hypothetical protein n=1 Tax=Pseudomonas aeruginosa TaxID=287 RepID=UPI000E30DB70|nr:hypothetical protein [Pseudomonas aeruginosa]MCG3026802.1 hypothetical protein [Pseudomonas aeruginosa]NPZ48399.1 hypothetical protein [Pseudomonas aeruginosa]